MARSELTMIYPEIALNSESITAFTGGNQSLVKNLFYGGASLYYERNSAGTTTQIRFDLGSGNSSTIDFVAIRRANLLTSLDEGNARIRINASNDNWSTTTELFDFENLGTDDLIYGSDLFVHSETPSGSFRYFELRLDTTASVVHRLGKCYFGMLVDLQRSPSYPYQIEYLGSSNAFVSDSGSTFKTQLRAKKRRFEFTWKAIPDIYRDYFDILIGRYLDSFQLGLVHNQDGTENSPLGAYPIVWGYAEHETKTGPVANLNELTIRLTEDVA